MIKLNDYLYSGNTVRKIIRTYMKDLREDAARTHNVIDIAHCNFLFQLKETLEHNDFIDEQASKITEFYKFMTEKYPFLAFNFKGRIKSLIRAEQKFNGNLVEYIYDYYKEHKSYPDEHQIKERVKMFRDLIAYRIVIDVPKCHCETEEERRNEEIKIIYEIANILPEFMEMRGFQMELAASKGANMNPMLKNSLIPYYRDYIENPSPFGYQSLHITFYDLSARCNIEFQIRTKKMDDYAEIGPANHFGYERRQDEERSRREEIPVGECPYFDDAYERGIALQQLDLTKLDVNMFTAYSNSLINDGCGLFMGRLIRPHEHLSKFQND